MTERAAPKAPPFCPNPVCPYHKPTTTSWAVKRDGFHRRRAAPRCVQRYRCGHCGRSFSDQTFATTYWLKRPELLVEAFEAIVHATGLRQLARKHRCSPQTIKLHSDRIGRHCILFHNRHRPKQPNDEPLCVDGLRNFEYSQFHPSEYLLAMGHGSHFTYGFEHAELRRMGRMTRAQERTRERLERDHGRPSPRAIRDGLARLLACVAGAARTLVIYSDEHPEYPRAIAMLKGVRVTHCTVSSRAARTPGNILFPINLMDVIARHCLAIMRRETIAFSKAIASAVLRMWALVVWRNHCKWFSERNHGCTPAMQVGVADRRWSTREVLRERLFPSREELPEMWQMHYWMQLPTRCLKNGRQHQLRYAF